MATPSAFMFNLQDARGRPEAPRADAGSPGRNRSHHCRRKPVDTVTVVFKLESVKAGGSGPKKVEHLTFASIGRKSTIPAKPSFQLILIDAEYDRFCTMHGDYISHGTLSPSPPKGITVRPTHQEWRW
jgi:hypothetical protein